MFTPNKEVLMKEQSKISFLSFCWRIYLLTYLCLSLIKCSFPIEYSITNQKRTEKVINHDKLLGPKRKISPIKYTNKTTFPSMTLWLEQTSQKIGPKCEGYHLSLTMTSPQALNSELSLIQSIVTIQVANHHVEKDILYTNQEILTFSSVQSVNEENFLQKAVIRLLDQVIIWCASKD